MYVGDSRVLLIEACRALRVLKSKALLGDKFFSNYTLPT